MSSWLKPNRDAVVDVTKIGEESQSQSQNILVINAQMALNHVKKL